MRRVLLLTDEEIDLILKWYENAPQDDVLAEEDDDLEEKIRSVRLK